MTSRDWPSPESGTAIPAAATAEGTLRSAATHRAAASVTLPASTSLWEEWYQAASPVQREQFLEQARQQGLLFSHQLPVPDRPASQTPGSAGSAVLTTLLAACSRDPKLTGLHLPPVPELAPLEPFDRELDANQRQAVARAFATPDVSLIVGYPGAGKTRLVTELARQSLHKGGRVLLVAVDGPTIDRALDQLADAPSLRWLGEHEDSSSLTPRAAARTLTGRVQHYQQTTLPTARRRAAEAAGQFERRRQQATLWPRLEAIVEEQQSLRARQSAVAQDEANLTALVTAELQAPGPDSRLRKDWQACLERFSTELTELHQRLTALRGERDVLDAKHKECDHQRQHLEPLVEAKQSNRWWTGAFWRATVSDPRPQLEEITTHCHEAETRLNTLNAELQDLETKVATLEAQRAQEQQQLLEAETTRRGGEVAARKAEDAGKQELLEATWEAAFAELDMPCPAACNRDALLQARADWARLGEQAETEAALRREWLAIVERVTPAALAQEWLTGAQLIGATTLGLPLEPTPGLDHFDLVVLEEAQRASDSDLIALARRGKRLILVGDAEPELPIAPPPRSRSRGDRRTDTVSGTASTTLILTPPFVRLWRALHPDPRRLPGRWRNADGRLVVTMQALSAEDQHHLQREQVFDRPEIELGIVVEGDREPRVAQVTFPGHTSIAEAKAYIHGELQELAVHATALQPHWRETDAHLILELSAESIPETCTVTLEQGVQEKLGRCLCHAAAGEFSWQTLAITFDKAAGWDRARSEGWVEEKLGLRDRGRTSILGKSYRAQPDVWRFVSELLYNGASSSAADLPLLPQGPAHKPVVEFHAVPAGPRGANEARRTEPVTRWNGSATATLTRGQTRPTRGGAGLEVDLSDPRRVDALPNELRAQLPGRGVINYLEARAVVQTLEELVSNPEVLAACLDWHRGARRSDSPTIAVLSIFPAQVELLRLLIGRSAVLSKSGIAIEVGQPRQLAQREALIVVVSLTRSHVTRAVPFSDHPRELMMALTRAAGRLLLFGDPGTMNRRSQWFGVLDHLDEVSGPLEQALVGQLLASLGEPGVSGAVTPPSPVEAAAPQQRVYAGK